MDQEYPSCLCRLPPINFPFSFPHFISAHSLLCLLLWIISFQSGLDRSSIFLLMDIKKKKKSLQFGVCCCSTGGKRSWEDPDQGDNVPLSLPSAVDWRYKMFCTHKDKNFLCYQVTSDNVDMFSLLNYFMHCIKNYLVCFCKNETRL